MEVQKEKMLRPEDVAESVWEAVDKPNNVHVNDVLIIRDVWKQVSAAMPSSYKEKLKF